MLAGPDLFRVIADQIEAHPEKYDQGTFGRDDSDDSTPFLTVAEHMAINHCGTRGCIAGWAAAFNIMDPEVRTPLSTTNYDLSIISGKLLGLNKEDSYMLFDEHWKPADGLTVPDALRQMADGASVLDVTYVDEPDQSYDDDYESDDDRYDRYN